LLFLSSAPAYAIGYVTLQLKWTHAFQFAGYYAAKEQGYYRDAGLDVDIREALPGDDPVKDVVGGEAEFGVGTSSLLLERKAGRPVVVLAVIFQHSAYVLIARRLSATQGIHDLVGKRVMLEPQSDELLAYLRQENIPLDRIIRLAHSYDPRDLITGKTDAMAAYVTELYYLDRAHFPYQTYTPRSAGIEFYGDNLFTSERELKTHPERVKAFRAASLRGWKYAMEHPDELIDLILAKYSQRHSRDYFQFEAKKTISLIHPELIEVGYMNPGRWRHIADTYAGIGMLPRGYSIEGFLYDPDPQRDDPTWLYRWLAVALVLSAIAGVIAYRFARLSRALSASEGRYRLIADNVQDVLWKYEFGRQRASYVSPSISRLTGFTPEEAMAQSLDDALTPASVELLRKAISSLIEHPEAAKKVLELEACCKNGSTVWTEDTISIIRDDAGRATEVIGISRDLTERRKAQEEQKRFVAMVSHEFRTPLATIDGAVQRLAASAEQASEATRKRYAYIQQAADRLTALLDDYLTQDQFGTGERSLHLKHLSPAALLKDALASASALSGGHHFTLMEADMPDTVLCDQGMMRLALRVLADNAVKYTPPGSEIRFTCRPARDQGVEFLISDNGLGIPPDELPHVFKKFFRGRRTGQLAGFGVGLHLAHSVVTSHGGTLTVRNLPEGGTEFRVWLPSIPVNWKAGPKG
jgi:PAS domain S-box-containing protein